jgi:hypothetical protein
MICTTSVSAAADGFIHVPAVESRALAPPGHGRIGRALQRNPLRNLRVTHSEGVARLTSSASSASQACRDACALTSEVVQTGDTTTAPSHTLSTASCTPVPAGPGLSAMEESTFVTLPSFQ